jgi:hypothetical protein
MFGDKNLELAKAQAVTTAAIIGNYLDLEEGGAVDNMLGPSYLNVIVETAFAGMASGAAIELRTSDNADLVTGARVLASIGNDDKPLTAAMLTEGARFSVQVPGAICDKYLGAFWNPVSEAASAGKLDVSIDPFPLYPLKQQKV